MWGFIFDIRKENLKSKDSPMNELRELKDLENPLTKGDFLKFRYEVRKDIFLGLSYVTGTCAIAFITIGIFGFFSGNFWAEVLKSS
jgi:hypothetical protein